MRIATITRQTLRKLTPIARTHDTPPSTTRIAQAKAERSLIDLVAACRVPGVDIKVIIDSIASKSARLDELGKRDIGDEIDSISYTLRSISDKADQFWDCYSKNEAAGASMGGGIPQYPSDCATLPPAVIDQINRKIDRDALRSDFTAQSVRGCSSLIEVSDRVDRLMRTHDATQLTHTILGPGGDFDKPLYA